MGVRLGDDVYEDDVVTKRVLFRFLPDFQEVVVWPVSNEGDALVVEDPVGFLRRFVTAVEVLVQTTSSNGTVLFSQFVVSPQAVENLSRVAGSCGWIVDPDVLEATQRRDAETMFAIERQRVLNTYVGTPLRHDLRQVRVNADGDIYMELPSPVDRAYLGFGVSVGDVERTRKLDRGVLCLAGGWVVDEIILRDCYPEDSFDQGLLGGLVDLPHLEPPPQVPESSPRSRPSHASLRLEGWTRPEGTSHVRRRLAGGRCVRVGLRFGGARGGHSSFGPFPRPSESTRRGSTAAPARSMPRNVFPLLVSSPRPGSCRSPSAPLPRRFARSCRRAALPSAGTPTGCPR